MFWTPEPYGTLFKYLHRERESRRVLNSNAIASDGATLIHEMIHAAHSGPVPHDGEANSVFFGERKAGQGAVPRTLLKADRALTLSKAFFST